MSRLDRIRRQVIAAATGPFQHAPYPLAETLDYEGDPGLFGPSSVSWRVIGDAAAFIGGVRALLIQAAHPEVVAGVHDHSRYREDPLGRLSRTSSYVTATTFGAMPEVERAVAVVRRAHRPVTGASHRGRPYAADDAALAAWVHNALTDSFLASYQAYGRYRLTEEEADRFVAEQNRVGELLHAAPLPGSAAELRIWLASHPDAAGSPGMVETVDFLTDPPLSGGTRAGYKILFQAALATIPLRLRSVLGLTPVPGARRSGRIAARFLRWALGASPSWNLALIRVGAPVPDGVFRQRLPVAMEHDRAL